MAGLSLQQVAAGAAGAGTRAPAGPNPFTSLNRLPANAFEYRPEQRGWVERGETGAEEVTQNAGYYFGDENFRQQYLDPYGLGSKYGGLIDLGDGRVEMRLQQPGAHKYDTMGAIYSKDPSTGEWVLQGNPYDNPRRQISSGEILRDNVEQDAGTAAKMVAAAAALYGVGYGLNAMIGGAGGGAGAGAGEALAGAGAEAGTTGTLGTIPAGAGPQAGALSTMGNATAPTLASVPSMGGAGGGMLSGMSYWDMARTGMGLYGMYQNEKALDGAQSAANEANAISREAAQRQAALAEASYKNYIDNIQPGLLEDAKFARERARTTAGQADRLFNEQIDDAAYYRNRWRNTQVPLEDEIIANARRLGTQDEQDRLAGLAMTDVRGNFSDMRAMRERDAQRSGVNLNSGAARALAEEAFMAEALAGASAGTGARFAAMDRYRSGMTDAAALGRGLPGFSSSASGGATGAGGLSIQAGQAGVQAGVGTSGAMTGAQSGISNMWGQSSNSALNGFNAVSNYTNLVRQSPWSTVAGTVFGDWMGGGKP